MSFKSTDEYIDILKYVDTDWPNQFQILKTQFDKNILIVKYLDNENEEVGINGQQDYDYALQYAAEQGGYIILILKDITGSIITKLKFLTNKTNTDQSTEDSNSQKSKDSNSQEWFTNCLSQFKKDLLIEMDNKIKNLIGKNDGPKKIEAYEIDDIVEIEEKADKLLELLTNVKCVERPLKRAYIEEELNLSGAFQANFLCDSNLPDGSQCGPNLKFTKKWLIQNTGKLAWSDDNFPVKLVCVAGNISTLNQDIVNVFEAPVDSTIEVAVNLVSPSQPGEYYTEWAFVCKDFQFGPRLWCAIEVVKNQTKAESPAFYDTTFSEDEEFVVVPDCLDLTKKWKPDECSRQNENKSSIFELSQNSENYIDQCGSEANNALIQIIQDNKAILNEISNAQELSKMSQSNAVCLDNSISKDLVLNTDVTKSVIKNEEQSLATENLSKFDMIKNAFVDIKGPENIGDTKIDFAELENPISDAIKKKTNDSVSQITSAIGSLGSMYQSSSMSLFEQHMKTLITMGFANRTLNKRLLNKYDNNMDKVLQSLLDNNSYNWN